MPRFSGPVQGNRHARERLPVFQLPALQAPAADLPVYVLCKSSVLLHPPRPTIPVTRFGSNSPLRRRAGRRPQATYVHPTDYPSPYPDKVSRRERLSRLRHDSDRPSPALPVTIVFKLGWRSFQSRRACSRSSCSNALAILSISGR
jgi:hypothetical protein